MEAQKSRKERKEAKKGLKKLTQADFDNSSAIVPGTRYDNPLGGQ